MTRLRLESDSLVKKWAWRQDQALAEDVEMAGWEALCAQHDPLAAMQNEITRWLWGVTRGQRARTLTRAVALEQVLGLQGMEAEPDRVAEARITVERLWNSAPLDERLVWVFLVEHGQKVPRRVYEQVGWNSNVFHDRRAALRRRFIQVLTDLPIGRNLHIRRRPRRPVLLGSPARPIGNKMSEWQRYGPYAPV